jgi:hypothetical protein
MGKVSAEDYGSSTPKITPDDLEGDFTILTVTGFETVDVDDDGVEGGKRKSATLTFEETENKVLWLNKGMIEALCTQLGTESDNWTGKQVPVEKYTARYGNKSYPKVRVMPSEEWDKAFKDAGVKRKHPGSYPVKAAAPAPKAGAVKKGGKR